MSHVCPIDENPLTGSLWVAGFGMDSVPEYPGPYVEAFYEHRLVEIPIGAVTVTATSLLDSGSRDSALPMVVLWTGPTTVGYADLHGDGKVTLRDPVTLAAHWGQDCSPPSWCDGVDIYIRNRTTPADLGILAGHWLSRVTP